MKFVDEVVVRCSSGDGAPGVVHFRREKFVPRGGPDGGNGGKGGSVIVVGDSQRRTLVEYSFKRNFRAENGKSGAGSHKTGADGKDLYIYLPLGTEIYDDETGEFLLDVSEAKEYHFMQGGRGGMGNAFFKSPTRQTPDFAQPGEKGESRSLRLSLKLIADVGLVGFPNAGKSTLLSVVTRAKPKIANYEFTTLVPNLGAVTDYDFLIADIPGLIEGAHEGKGLGIQFLKHIERVKVLLFLLDPTRLSEEGNQTLVQQYEKLMHELQQFNPLLTTKPKAIAISKCDLEENVDDNEVGEAIASLSSTVRGDGTEIFRMSSVSHEGLKEVMFHLSKLVTTACPE